MNNTTKKTATINSWILIAIILLLLIITIFVGKFFKSENKLQVLLKNEQTISCFFALYDSDDYKIQKSFVLFYNGATNRVCGVHILPDTYTAFTKGNRSTFLTLSKTLTNGLTKEEIKNGISKLLGTNINYHIFLSKENLVKYVDLVSGIEIFTEEISIPEKHIYYPSGVVNLDGDKIIEFLSIQKNGENEYEQLKRTEIFVRSLINLKDDFLETFSDKMISDYIYPLIQTNLSLNDILVFFNQINAKFEHGITNYSRNFISLIIYCDKDFNDNQTIYLPKKSGSWVRSEIKEMLVALTKKEVKEIGNKITVQILNGTDIVGFANRSKQYLESYGFDVIETGNADHSDYKNTVIVIRNSETKALKLADLIKCKRTTYKTSTTDPTAASSQTEDKIDVTLILGRDFDGRVVK